MLLESVIEIGIKIPEILDTPGKNLIVKHFVQ